MPSVATAMICPPCFCAVKGLGCLSKGMRQQIHRLWPLVGVRSLADVQGPTHGPWLVKLLYQGVLTDAVVEQARQARGACARSTQGAWCGPTWSRSCWARAARYSNWIYRTATHGHCRVTAGDLMGKKDPIHRINKRQKYLYYYTLYTVDTPLTFYPVLYPRP